MCVCDYSICICIAEREIRQCKNIAKFFQNLPFQLAKFCILHPKFELFFFFFLQKTAGTDFSSQNSHHHHLYMFLPNPDHSRSQIEDGYRKEITFLFSHLLIHCLYSCCGSLAFTIICCIVFTCVVDPWYLQLFADPLPL